MTRATVTSKGQVTIPKEIGLLKTRRSKVDFVDSDGQVKVIPLNVPAQVRDSAPSGDESGNYPGNGGGDCAGRTLRERRGG